TTTSGDDVAYELVNDATVTPAQRLFTRQDINSKQISQLANRIDALQFEFFDAGGAVVAPDKAVKVRITVTVSLPSVGTPRSPGYQPPTRMPLRSAATLRNSPPKQSTEWTQIYGGAGADPESVRRRQAREGR